MGIVVEFNPDLALRNISEFMAGKRKKQECIPEPMKIGEVYDFLKEGQRLYYFGGEELPLLETKGNANLSEPLASIIILEATHYREDGKVFTKGKYKIVKIIAEGEIYFNGINKAYKGNNLNINWKIMEKVTRIAGIIIQDEKMLMVLGKKHQELWTPGGKIEPGETDEVCLSRELKEEIGVELLICEFFKEYTNPSFYHPERTTIERVYIAKVSGQIKPASEIRDFVWLCKEDFENKKYPMITNDQEKLIPDLIKAGIW
ncbi:MAG: hypothetical protein A2312_03095 [Candidatus Staskawiczbacteria bacterium RIFOXYB2_FULL_32_9]|uniref:Nudix hydrolase domain-containing protein n=1 Tax=Candidatus Staskawiczbacteria bacterium RIFOXYD1_FULL_32_13 TaxID=1802234 RepID=A0A1G2JRU4_9BACT|nr:MAG: MutT/NUDIX family protein [Parcubacteria group bacterium GW2011_GWC2_32_10]OGZ79663.1 MAG: hypothetical protein A2360_01905 [Candidatus Staskawiczbacteria bacterium RIFOXYB1_FULL_32_11]OGZ81086.1 MAG: hypothetical protein A2256_03295 [Candidatus Staskawiczbacteria bacterium RIFOXYA2_FULL_32_7]OGZ81131.1 MAG: hypothetical protein A2312_03095 [Candidatus Staskawiczbacteria bacterium RIFOXYB2_FULL_32_9]OGZ85493.1 MAG: hypothetical protein A2463_02330 [Candidatus Staskawiczbacteria bacteriu